MRKTLMYALPVTLALGAAAGGIAIGHANAATLFPLFPNVEQVRDSNPAGAGFGGSLAKEYKDLALFEADDMGDWKDAELFAGKSLRSGAGDVPMPIEPETRSISDAAARSELQSSRTELVGLLQAGGREIAPTEAAVAQTRYDCWVEQEEEGHQFDHIAACRASYMAAIEALKAAMQPTEVTYEVVQEEIARETVYFDWDKDGIRDDQKRELDAFLGRMREIEPVTLYIEGHADTSGAQDYNADLSRRRAENVRAELLSQGMTVGEAKDLQVQARGENDPAVATGDGVKEERNRRVVVIATGQSKKEKTVKVDQSAATTKQ